MIPVFAPLIEALFPVHVAAAELRGPGDPASLFPEEAAGQQRWAEKRIHEYAAGRQCAHEAMRRLGVDPVPLISQPDRRPRWPDGVAGNISHCRGFSAAVVARDTDTVSLGVDVELAEAVEPHLWPRILVGDELEWLHSRPAEERRLWATLVFSAKESFYKCQYGVTQRFLEFADARMQVVTKDAGPEGPWDIEVRSGEMVLGGRAIRIDGWICSGFAWPAGRPQ